MAAEFVVPRQKIKILKFIQVGFDHLVKYHQIFLNIIGKNKLAAIFIGPQKKSDRQY
jgi:hypothetical protein